MARVMVDIETLSLKPTAVVTAIGIAYFDTEKVLDSKCWYLDYTTDLGGHIDPGTLRWWLTQNANTQRKNLLGAAIPLHTGPYIHSAFRDHEVWANSPQFDCVILEHWFKRHGWGTPWTHRALRDCRTLFEIGKLLDVETPPDRESHDAQQDAIWQAEYVLAIEKRILRV